MKLLTAFWLVVFLVAADLFFPELPFAHKFAGSMALVVVGGIVFELVKKNNYASRQSSN